MPDSLGGPSEFGGKIKPNGVQPAPHVPVPHERMMLLHTTGDESGLADKDNGEAMVGLLPERVQRQARQDEGALDKGQVWEQMQAEGAQAVQALKDATSGGA